MLAQSPASVTLNFVFNPVIPRFMRGIHGSASTWAPIRCSALAADKWVSRVKRRMKGRVWARQCTENCSSAGTAGTPLTDWKFWKRALLKPIQ